MSTNKHETTVAPKLEQFANIQVLHREGHYVGSFMGSTGVLHREGNYMGSFMASTP